MSRRRRSQAQKSDALGALPDLRPGAGRGLSAPLAAESDLRALGLPARLEPDWPRRFLEALDRAVRRKPGPGSIHALLHTAAGPASGRARFFWEAGDPNNMPMARADLMRRVYMRYLADKGWPQPKMDAHASR